ncbi:MAG TPA: hypothetical protein VJZ71_17650 [Phycisphaerae bacterium]|nr:hypothetical protein [Phycisphaerae bacterium]
MVEIEDKLASIDEMESGRPERFSDETATGETNQELRGPRRISIAARFDPDPNSFDWVRRLYSDYAHWIKAPEIKSSDVISLCQVNPRAKDQVIRNIREADIFVIDLFEDYHQTLDSLKKMAPDQKRPLESLAAANRLDREEIVNFLADERRVAVLRSIVPIIEDLTKQATVVHDGALHRFEHSALVDLDKIGDLGEQDLKELIVRFTVLFSDALNPEVRARAIESVISSRCYGSRGHVAMEVLELATAHDMVFDRGSDRAMNRLIEADNRLHEHLEAINLRGLQRPRRGIRQQDSRDVLGVQAADIAAGFARKRFEDFFQGDTTVAAKRLREEFAHVLLNTKWL